MYYYLSVATIIITNFSPIKTVIINNYPYACAVSHDIVRIRNASKKVSVRIYGAVCYDLAVHFTRIHSGPMFSMPLLNDAPSRPAHTIISVSPATELAKPDPHLSGHVFPVASIPDIDDLSCVHLGSLIHINESSASEPLTTKDLII